MQLGFVVPGSLARQSGGLLYDRMLVEHLRRRGWQVDIIPFPWGSYAGDLLHNIPRKAPPGFDPASIDLLLEDELSHPGLLSFNRWIRRETDLPIITVVHHLRSSEARSVWLNAFYRRVEHAYLADVDGAVCNSHATRRSVEALWPEARPSLVAYPGRNSQESRIDAAGVRQRAHRDGPARLIFLGNIIPRKGLVTLLRALAAISNLDWELEIIGDPTLDRAHVRRIRRLIARRGLEDRIALLGRLDDSSLTAHLAQAHLMTVPSDHEGFGIAYLDGMAHGLPAVATTAGGASELVRHGHNGLLVTPGDIDGLAAGLAGLIQDREALAELGVAALATHRDHPSWSDIVDRVRSFVLGFKRQADRPATTEFSSHHHTTVGGPA